MFRRLSAPRLIALGFAVFMVLGTLLLRLPASTYDDISWVDALFVSVSAVSVTGLTSVPFPGTFTTFGIVVVMLLVQVGGLGVMTFATLGAVLIGQRVGFRNLLTVREELGSTDSPRNVFRLIGQIAGITLLVEAAGAVVLAAGFIGSGFGYGQGLFQAVFHAIAAFCNAGFVALPEGDLTSYAGVSSVNLTLVALIVLGGLGFPVLVNLYHYRQMRRLTLHSKLVLVTSATLVLIGVLSVAFLEWANPATLGGEPTATRLWESLFQGVTPRTAGFSTVDYAQMHESTLFLQIGLMFIGTAPASTGGGGQGHNSRALGAPLTRASAGAGGCERLRTPDIQAAHSEGARGTLDFGSRRHLGDARDNDLRRLETRASHLRGHQCLRYGGTLHAGLAGALDVR